MSVLQKVMTKLNGLNLVIAFITYSVGERTGNYTSDHDFCPNYSTAMTCVNDPCCKTGSPSFPESSCCEYCYQPGDTQSGSCMAKRLMSHTCPTDCVQVSNVCPSKNTASQCRKAPVPAVSQPPIVRSHGYYLNLTMTDTIVTNMTMGMSMAADFFTNVATNDAVMSACCTGCSAPLLLCEWTDTYHWCWSLGDLSKMKGLFKSKTDPTKGVILHYGTTFCCLRGLEEAPGRTGEIDVEMVIVPDYNPSEGNKMWRINLFPNASFIKNCSMAVAGRIGVEIALKDYSQRLFYELSPSLSNFSCNDIWEKGDTIVTLRCQVFPVWAVNSSAASSSVCLRLQLLFSYFNGSSDVVSMSKVHHYSGQCNFMESRNKSLLSLAVLDSDGTPIGQQHNISVPSQFSKHSSNLGMYIGIGVVIFLAVCVVVGIIIYYNIRKRKKLRDGSEDGDPLLNNEPGSEGEETDKGNEQGKKEEEEEEEEQLQQQPPLQINVTVIVQKNDSLESGTLLETQQMLEDINQSIGAGNQEQQTAERTGDVE